MWRHASVAPHFEGRSANETQSSDREAAGRERMETQSLALAWAAQAADRRIVFAKTTTFAQAFRARTGMRKAAQFIIMRS